MALEGRSYVLSVSGLLRKSDIPMDLPYAELLRLSVENEPNGVICNGGSAIAGPNGEWIVPPVINEEGLIFATLPFDKVLEERQNFDPVGHYSRPDLFQLRVNTSRQQVVKYSSKL